MCVWGVQSEGREKAQLGEDNSLCPLRHGVGKYKDGSPCVSGRGADCDLGLRVWSHTLAPS